MEGICPKCKHMLTVGDLIIHRVESIVTGLVWCTCICCTQSRVVCLPYNLELSQSLISPWLINIHIHKAIKFGWIIVVFTQHLWAGGGCVCGGRGWGVVKVFVDVKIQSFLVYPFFGKLVFR